MADYGSFVNVAAGTDRHEFQGLEKDFPKLPTEGIRTGSTAYIIDRAELYMFEETTKTWYKQ